MSDWKKELEKQRRRRDFDKIRVIQFYIRGQRYGYPIRHSKINLRQAKEFMFWYNKQLGKEKGGRLKYKLEWARKDDYEDKDIKILDRIPITFERSGPFSKWKRDKTVLD